MDQAEQTLAKLVEQRLKALNTNAFAFEKAHGFPADALRSVLRGEKKSGTALNRAQEICEALGLELYIGPPRDAGSVKVLPGKKGEFAHIPVHRASLAAGDGCDNTGEEVIDHLAFRRSWLRQIGVSPSNAVLARAEGESMQPTIHPGDMLLIDASRNAPPSRRRSQNDKRPAPIYALLQEGHARVKRLERMDGNTIALLSDNLDYRAELMPVEAIDLIGKVMWWGHTVKE